MVVLGLAIALLGATAQANVFALRDTSARFTLTITPTHVHYDSETLRRSHALNECSVKLARALNTEIFVLVPRAAYTNGWRFALDGKEIRVDPKGPLAAHALGMDQRMLVFAEAEKKCTAKPN